MRVSGPVAAHNYSRSTQDKFYGIHHTPGASDGEIYSMINCTADYYPLLATREESWKKESSPAGRYAYLHGYKATNGRRVWVYRTGQTTNSARVIKADGTYLSTQLLTEYFDTPREIVEVNGKICIFPDHYYYDTAAENANTYTDLSSVLAREEVEGNYVLVGTTVKTRYRYWINMWRTCEDCQQMNTYYVGTFTTEDGTYAGQSAEKNTIKIALANLTNTFFPEVGDAVTIWKGQSTEKTAIIREMAADTDYVYLRFYENTFSANGSHTGIIEREIPDLEHVFEHENRIWGSKGKEIYCCHLGNPLNWYDYESLADGSWEVELGEGEITGCVSYNYPLFFTEDKIYTILGDEPAEYSLSVTPNTYGLAEGSHKSFAIVRGYLFYHSPYGFCYYYGSMPYLCDEDLGPGYYYNAVGGTKGTKYYVCCKDGDEDVHTFVYDTENKLWHEEQNAFHYDVMEYGWDGDLYAVVGDGVYTMGIPRDKPSPAVSEYASGEAVETSMASSVTFAPYYADSLDKKQVKSVIIRHEITGSLTAKIYVDGTENVSLRKTMTGTGVTEIVGIPERCDHWYLKLEGTGAWKVYAIGYDYYKGTVKK